MMRFQAHRSLKGHARTARGRKALSLALLAVLAAVLLALPSQAAAQSAPAQVTGLTLTRVSNISLTAAWAAATDAEEYMVEASTSSTFATRTRIFTTSTSQTFSGLTENATYHVRVRALSHDDLWIVDASDDELWRADTNDPDLVARNQGSFPARLTAATGIEIISATEVLVADDGSNGLWRINPSDPSDTSGDYGKVGDFPSGLNSPRGMAIDSNGDLWITDNTDDDLWKINPANPSDTSGDYGRVGLLPTGNDADSAAFDSAGNLWTADRDSDELYLINTADPDDTSGDFGLHCSFGSGFGIAIGLAVDSHGDVWVSAYHTRKDSRLSRIDIGDCDRTTGGYGDQGQINDGIRRPHSIALIENPDGPWSATASLSLEVGLLSRIVFVVGAGQGGRYGYSSPDSYGTLVSGFNRGLLADDTDRTVAKIYEDNDGFWYFFYSGGDKDQWLSNQDALDAITVTVFYEDGRDERHFVLGGFIEEVLTGNGLKLDPPIPSRDWESRDTQEVAIEFRRYIAAVLPTDPVVLVDPPGTEGSFVRFLSETTPGGPIVGQSLIVIIVYIMFLRGAPSTPMGIIMSAVVLILTPWVPVLFGYGDPLAAGIIFVNVLAGAYCYKVFVARTE